VYQDGSRDEQVMNVVVSSREKKTSYKPSEMKTMELSDSTVGDTAPQPYAAAIQPLKLERPVRVSGETIAINTSYGKMYLTINSMGGAPFETSATWPKLAA